MRRLMHVVLHTCQEHAAFGLVLFILFSGVASISFSAYPLFFRNAAWVFSGFDDALSALARSDAWQNSVLGFGSLFFYQWFLVPVGGCILGYSASLLLSQEISAQTIDILLSTPLSRKELAFAKFLGYALILLAVTLGLSLTIILILIGVGEAFDSSRILITHGVLLLYFYAVASLGFLLSCSVFHKRKAGLVTIIIIIGMIFCETFSRLLSDFSFTGFFSLTHFFNPDELLVQGGVDLIGIIVLLCFAAESILVGLVMFMKRDIRIPLHPPA